MITEITIGSVTVKLLSDHDRVVAAVERDGNFEPESLAEWSRMAAGGGLLIDIGAYTGIFTIIGRLLKCEVLAIEPMSENCERLRMNADLNGVSRSVVEAAAAGHAGRATLHHSALRLTSGGSLRISASRPYTRDVEAVKIDDFQLPAVSGMKIDVENAEAAVLRGARETLERCHPELIVELLGDRRRSRGFQVPPGYKIARKLDTRNYLMVPV